MSRQSIASPIHPACGYRCMKCTDRIIYTQTEVRTLYCMAVEETDQKEIFRAHMEYLTDPSMRLEEIPQKICRTCGEELFIDTLPPVQADELIRACRATDATNEYLYRWAEAGFNLNQVIAAWLFSDIKVWWRTELPCLRAALNTAWRAGISGMSMLILSNMFENCYMEELDALDPSDEELDTDEELVTEEEPAMVIPPIMIPTNYNYYPASREMPTSATFWDGLSERTVRDLCENTFYDWDVMDQAWFQEHKHLIA